MAAIETPSKSGKLFDGVNHLVLAVLGLACVFPLIHVFAVSLSSRAAVQGRRVFFWPVGFNLTNYQEILNNPIFVDAFVTSTVRVALGTTINLIVIVLTAYPLSLAKEFPGKGSFRWLLIFTMLFNGGMIPLYLLVKSLNMLDTMAALVLPTAVNVFYIIVMTNFFRGLPQELYEAAVVDGASHWRILFTIYIPLSVPGLLTLGLFSAVFHWNSWFDGLIYMTSASDYPLQSYLQTFLTATAGVTDMDPRMQAMLSDQAQKAAQIVVATVPILIVYPFIQRHFVAGMTLGAIKQ